MCSLHSVAKTLFQFINILLYSQFSPYHIGTKTVTMNLTKKSAVKLSDHTHITYLLSTSLASCNLKNWFRCFVPHIRLYVTITNSQRHKKRIHIVIHFNLSRSFSRRSFVCGIVKNVCRTKTNIMLIEMLENILPLKNLGPSEIEGLGLSFSA